MGLGGTWITYATALRGFRNQELGIAIVVMGMFTMTIG